MDEIERGIDRHDPLQLHLRFDHRARALGRRHIMRIGLLFHDEAFFSELLDDLRTRVRALHAGEFARDREELAVLVDDLLLVEAVALSDVEVGRVMPRRDRHGARSELAVYRRILHYGRRYGAIDP